MRRAIPITPEQSFFLKKHHERHKRRYLLARQYAYARAVCNHVLPSGRRTRCTRERKVHRPFAGLVQKAVNWAAANGIINGTSDTTFSPNAAITREQAAAILSTDTHKARGLTYRLTIATFTPRLKATTIFRIYRTTQKFRSHGALMKTLCLSTRLQDTNMQSIRKLHRQEPIPRRCFGNFLMFLKTIKKGDVI